MKQVALYFQQWNIHLSMNPAEFKELLLSHHPNYPCFDDDIVKIFNKRICAGCLFGYPAAFLTIVLVHPSGIIGIFIALTLAAFSQMRRFTMNRYLKNGFRLIAGIALGFGLGSGYWAIITGQWAMVVLLAIGVCLYILFKLNSMRKKIQKIC